MAYKPEFSKANIARSYRDKHGMEMPTRQLARIMHQENPDLFHTIDNARIALSRIEGKMKNHPTKPNYMATHSYPERVKNPYKFPDSDETSFEPFVLGAKKILVLSDIHIPYHSIAALTAAFEFAEKEKPDCVLLNGDTLDFFSLSKFVKDPKKRSFAEELDTFAEFFTILKKIFNCRVVFKTGNHCERYQHFLWSRGKELDGVNEFELETIIKNRAPQVEYVDKKRIIKAGGLNIIHGHEFASGFFSPVNVARGLFLRGKTSALQGHNHQTSEHTEPDMNGKITTTWSTGCLCELHPEYMPINKWNHGFAIVDIDGENFEVKNKRIYKGKIL